MYLLLILSLLYGGGECFTDSCVGCIDDCLTPTIQQESK